MLPHTMHWQSHYLYSSLTKAFLYILDKNEPDLVFLFFFFVHMALLGCNQSEEKLKSLVLKPWLTYLLISFSCLFVSCSLPVQWIRWGRCEASLMEDLTPTPSISKGLLQGPDPSKEAPPTQGRATDLLGLRGTRWGCRPAHLVRLVVCCMDSRSVFTHLSALLCVSVCRNNTLRSLPVAQSLSC